MRVADQRRRRGQGRARASTPPGPPAGGGEKKRPPPGGSGTQAPRRKTFRPQKNPPKTPKKRNCPRALLDQAQNDKEPKCDKNKKNVAARQTAPKRNGPRPQAPRRLRRRIQARCDAPVWGATCAPARSARFRQPPPKNKAGKQKRPFGPTADDFSIKPGRMRHRVVCSLKKASTPRSSRRQSKDRHGPPTQRNAWEKPLEGKNCLKTAKPTPPDRDGEYSSQGRFGRRAAALGGKHKEGEAFGDHRFGGPAPFCRFSNGFRILPARCLRRRANFDGFRARFLFFF